MKSVEEENEVRNLYENMVRYCKERKFTRDEARKFFEIFLLFSEIYGRQDKEQPFSERVKQCQQEIQANMQKI